MRLRHAGFTLIELSVTTAVLGILSSVALVPMQRLVEHQRASSTIESLQTHMALARTAAISRNRATVLCPTSDAVGCANSSDWSSGWMLFVDENRNRLRDPNEEVLRMDVREGGRPLRIASSNGRKRLVYHTDGSSAGTNLTLSICNNGGDLLGQVIVNNIGRPRSQRPKTPTPCPA